MGLKKTRPVLLSAALGCLSWLCATAYATAPASSSSPSCGSLWPPEDKTATARIGSMFERPADISKLLQNLKLAYDKKLLLATEFYDESNLLKFFGSDRVVSAGRVLPKMRGTANRTIQLAGDGRALGQLNVSLIISCLPEPEYKTAAGVIPAHTRRLGSATVTVAAAHFTVNAVRAAMGKESRFLPEHIGPHDLSPTGKGLLIYETPADYRDGRTTKAGAEISFYIKLSLAGRGPDYVNEPPFTGDDVVIGVEIFESER